MNIFVLTTGRSGSLTFIKACKHIHNYSAGHESRSGLVGAQHFAYPKKHIEADNRLSWFLGRLELYYGDEAFYVHLQRNVMDTANSFLKRFSDGIIHAYADSILLNGSNEASSLDICLDYCETVNSNIDAFLANKSKKMVFHLETASNDFITFWDRIGAAGELSSALSEWGTRYNKSVNKLRFFDKKPFAQFFRNL